MQKYEDNEEFPTCDDNIYFRAKAIVTNYWKLFALTPLPPDFGSNEIHVTPLQYSVTFLVLSGVSNYNYGIVLMYLFSYF
jgi:hypothetical protein